MKLLNNKKLLSLALIGILINGACGCSISSGIIKNESKQPMVKEEQSKQPKPLDTPLENLVQEEDVQQEENEINIYDVYVNDIEQLIEKEPAIEDFIPLIMDSIEKHINIYLVDPVLVAAMMKIENSDFDPYAVSPAAAVGPAQIIPETATEFGIKAFAPEYLQKARKYRRLARKAYQKAKKHLKAVDMKHAETYIRKSIQYNHKANLLFTKYEKDFKLKVEGKNEDELMQIDARVIPSVAIDFLVKHMAELLVERNGDIREAVSAYNAGLKAVLKAEGIPVIRETVKYQNKIINLMEFYRDENLID